MSEIENQSVGIPAKFHPSKNGKFPARKFGSKGEKRSFRAEWCEKYDWLHYDRVADAAFCHLCLTAEHEKKFLASTKRDQAFITRGYTNWRDATKAFISHLGSRCYKEAMATRELPKQTGDVGERLSIEHEQEKAENRAMLRIRTCASLLDKACHSGDTEMGTTATLRSCYACVPLTILLC